ncbi:MAG: metalloregulator ArsR/SmtB family transcription factor [Candidatus Pacebacteria bacterium]|nr:metalloregulator ArsR/SmtB family transcription factor [Candidatus Paceibacterota bacterium]
MNTDVHVQILKALADGTRLRLLRLLYHEELNVYELCQVLDMPQPRVSRHLAILRAAGLATVRREGTKIYYMLADLDIPHQAFRDYLEELGQSDHPDLQRLEESLRQRTKDAESFAESKAEQWDDIGKVLHSTRASLLALANMVPRGLTVADLGTGTGFMLPFLANLADHVFAVDQSSAMLRRARSRCRQLGLSNVTFVHKAVEDLTEDIPPCDALLLHFVVHQIARPPALLKRLKKYLKADGRLVIVDRVQHDDESAKEQFGSLWLGFSQQQMEDWLRKAGLDNVHWQPLSGNDLSTNTQFAIFVVTGQNSTRDDKQKLEED